MTPLNWDGFPKLVKDISAVITSKKQICSLFRGRSTDIWEMMAAICSMGCGSVVVVDGQNGQFLLDSEEKIKYQIPAYPSRVIDPSGMTDSFCGGFISGLRRNEDSLDALIHGNISACISGEGTGPFYCLDTLKQLVDSRVLNLKKMVKIV
jgi:sugar/nucleoside kinase (ribokinase family)